jgi:hypothetical protein
MRRRLALLCTHVERLAYLKGWRTRALCEGSAGTPPRCIASAASGFNNLPPHCR